MSLVAFALGAAQQYNKLSAEEREKAIKAKEAAEKTKSELDIYEKKKQIDLLYDKDESKYLTADQFRTFKQTEGPTYAKSGYEIFGTPVGGGKFEVSFKEIKTDKADTGKMFPDAASVQEYIGTTKSQWEKGGLGTPEFTIKGKGDEFEVGVKSASKTDKDGVVKSRIQPFLEPGTVITVPRTTVHKIVTEYGIANLKGKSTVERAIALINIAHPDFREDLIRQAEEMNILAPSSFFANGLKN